MESSLAAQVQCLKSTDADLTASSVPTARYPVQDGVYINTPQLLVGSRNNNVAHVPVIFGIATDDGGSFCSYDTTCTTELKCLQNNLYISEAYAQDIIDSELFPFPNNGGSISADSVNVSARVETDLTFRCVDSATVFAGSQSGAFKSAYYYESVRYATESSTYTKRPQERGYPEDAYNPNNVNDKGTVSAAYPLGRSSKHGVNMAG